jgi:hypothetical protein
MIAFILKLLRTLALPGGSDGELLSTRRKYHLLQAEWYARLAAEGEEERKREARTLPQNCETFHIR